MLPNPSKDLAEFIGICLGDGSTSTYQTSITLNASADKAYIPYVESLSRTLFPGATVSLVKRRDNAVDVRVTSKDVADFMKKNGIVSHAKFVPSWIKRSNTYTKSCIKGLFDTEGSISFKQYLSERGIRIYKQLNFRNVNQVLMIFVRDTLLALSLKPTMTLKRSLYLSNHASIATYSEIIGFSNPKLRKRSLITTIEQYNNLVM